MTEEQSKVKVASLYRMTQNWTILRVGFITHVYDDAKRRSV